MQAIRFDTNPLINFDSSKSIGDNINGPSILAVPDWIENSLGTYYCYFAHHNGKFIRLAYADNIKGPWSIYEPGVLHVDDCPCIGHVASPDVHIDQQQQKIILYYHGVEDNALQKNYSGQRSYVATSINGLDFHSELPVIGGFYFRVFQHDKRFYALAKSIDYVGGGSLWHCDHALGPFIYSHEIIPNMRHCAVNKRDDVLEVYYSCGHDCPERIYHASIDLTQERADWQAVNQKELLRPSLDYEGVNEALEASSFGTVKVPANQLRDPAYFCDPRDNKEYIFYSYAGEQGLAGAELIRDK